MSLTLLVQLLCLKPFFCSHVRFQSGTGSLGVVLNCKALPMNFGIARQYMNSIVINALSHAVNFILREFFDAFLAIMLAYGPISNFPWT